MDSNSLYGPVVYMDFSTTTLYCEAENDREAKAVDEMLDTLLNENTLRISHSSCCSLSKSD